MSQLAACVHPVPLSALLDLDKRESARYPCQQEAVTRPVDSPTPLSWGAKVKNISAGGIGLVLCFPFKPGTYLALTLEASQVRRTFLVRVVHVLDQVDGTWFVGSEFVKQLQESELEEIRKSS